MTRIALSSDPLALFRHYSKASDQNLLERFIMMINHLYQYHVFKSILDLTASQIQQGLLTFRLHDQRFFDLDEGNCKTIYGSTVNHFLNSIRPKNIYLITLKKLSYDVIIHEISHMIEKEGAVDLVEFAKVINADMSRPPGSIGLKKAIDQVLINEVAAYPSSKHGSELFARYFQIMSMSKEVSGLASVFGYSISISDSYFAKTRAWLNTVLYPTFLNIIDPAIANISNRYVMQIDSIKHKWSEQTTQSLHHNKKANWSKVTKSIKDY